MVKIVKTQDKHFMSYNKYVMKSYNMHFQKDKKLILAAHLNTNPNEAIVPSTACDYFILMYSLLFIVTDRPVVYNIYAFFFLFII